MEDIYRYQNFSHEASKSLALVKARPNEYNISQNIIHHLLHIVACCLIVFNRGAARQMQHLLQHDTTFLQKRIQQRTTKLDGVTKRVQHHATSWKTKKCIVQYVFSEKVLSRSNFIQQDTTRYNKVAKRVQHFIKH